MLGSLQIGFDRPGYLVLLTGLPVLWLFSYRGLSALGRIRCLVTLGWRSLVFGLLVLALAEMQWQQTSQRLTVIFLLDQSESVPPAKRALMLDYVVREVHAHRDEDSQDRAGIIVFGRDAAIEIPPYDDDIPVSDSFESLIEYRDATNLEAALKLAQASFPEDTSKRIVIVTDGNENLGSAESIAPNLVSNGIGIDIVPVELTARAEIAVEKLTLPTDIRRGAPFELRAVLNNLGAAQETRSPPTVKGTVTLTRLVGGQEEPVADHHVELPPGKTVISFTHQIDRPAMYTYRAVLRPDDPHDDMMTQNNTATAFTHVRGKGRVLLIEDRDNRGEFDFLINRLQTANLEVDLQPNDQLFTSLAELQAYDCVILANVPRSSGFDTATITSFRDDQIEMLVRNTEQMGCGLIMIGGPNSMGAGGWANSELEKAMPVDFQIKNAKIQAVGALALMMHATEMASGNHWQKVVAREAIKALGPMDYCGLIHWSNSSGDSWLWGGQQGITRLAGRRMQNLALLNRMSPGDMPEFEPSMKMALASFNKVPASIKHMIIISDGDPAAPLPATVNQYKKQGIKITTVAIGTHGPAGSTPLQNIARATGGQYYVVSDPKALPKIYQREARRISRPLVKDLDNVAPTIVFPHELLDGINGSLPPLTGMVLTTVKNNPLVEVAIRSPVPADPLNSTILATWTYGLGRTAVLTTDAGHRWANSWAQWPEYDKFFSQLVRWTMRPSDGQGKYTIATDYRDNKVKIVVTALDAQGDFRNYLNMGGSTIGPDLKADELTFQQRSAGRYEAEVDVAKAGSYHITVVPSPGEPPIMSGINVPYSAEFRDRDTNVGLLQRLVALRSGGGEAGVLFPDDLAPAKLDRLLEIDTFRKDLPRAVSITDIWPLLLLIAACAFFVDVLVRRVAIGTDWLMPCVQFARRALVGDRESVEDHDARLAQLRSKKAELSESIAQRRAAARFAPDADADAETSDVDQSVDDVDSDRTSSSKSPGKFRPTTPDQSESVDYTARLLEAKRRAWREEKKDQ